LGSTFKRINVDRIRNFVMVVPPSSEQIEIVDWIDRASIRVNSVYVSVERAIERLSEYRAALITNAVTGKIDVRDKVDLDAFE